MNEELAPKPQYQPRTEVFRKANGELNPMGFRSDLIQFATSNELPVRDVFKQFVERNYLDNKNLTPKELRLLAEKLSVGSNLEHAMLLIVHALDITPENAHSIIPKMFPDFSVYDMQVMGVIWEMEDILGWPRGTTYPQVKTWG